MSGSTVTLVPEEGTCTGADPAQSVPFVLGSSTLTMSFADGIIVYQVDTAAASSIAIALGCFDSNGEFTPEPVSPISNDTADAGQ